MRIKTVAAGPLFDDDGPRGARIVRRVRGISLEVLAFVLLTVLLPLFLLVAAAVDLHLWLRRRKPWVGVRLAAFLWWFLFGEIRALAGLLGIWVATAGPFGKGSLRRRRLLYALRLHWARSHMGGIKALFGLRFEIEDLDQATPGPIVIMMRHASIIDNLLPDYTVADAHGIGLRYVLKRELQVIPTIDIGGRWVPTVYVRRASTNPSGEIAALATLADELGAGEGILIYPEGTRATARKIARAQEVIAERQPEISTMANRLRNLLPPRLGGPLALLDRAEGVDVVFCGHFGFDGFQHVSDIWTGGLVAKTIRVRFWRCPAASIPEGEQARTAWLYEHWQALDHWVGEQRRRDAPTGGQAVDAARPVPRQVSKT